MEKIIGLIIMCHKKNTQQRFQQLMFNLGITDTDRDYNFKDDKTFDIILENSIKSGLLTKEDFKESKL